MSARLPRIFGYCAVFYDGTPGTEYRIAKPTGYAPDSVGATERVLPSAFDKTLYAADPVRAFLEHDSVLGELGRTWDGTLRLEVDRKGLRYEITPRDNGPGDVVLFVADLIRRGRCRGSSFSFDSAQVERQRDRSGATIFLIHSVRLLDVGPVITAAYRGTTCALRDDGLAARLAAYGYRARAVSVASL